MINEQQEETYKKNGIINEKMRLELQKMVKINNVEDTTDLIRKLKHSHILQNDINNLILLMAKYNDDDEKVHQEGQTECGFLWTYYTDIYNKIRKNEIDLSLLNKFLNILRYIEDGELDQYEGAVLVGNILKEMYIDSALKKGDKLEEKADADREERVKGLPISWRDFKSQNKS
jgi:hypothetical protein